jgi:hypothetical protein
MKVVFDKKKILTRLFTIGYKITSELALFILP